MSSNNYQAVSLSDKTCRICFETSNVDDMIVPCLCRGNSQYVHRDCLDTWRTTSDNIDAERKCFECNYEYNLEINNIQSRCSSWLFSFVVKYPMLFVFLHQGITLAMSYFLYVIDKNSLISKSVVVYFFFGIIGNTIFTGFSLLMDFIFLRHRRLYWRHVNCQKIGSVLSICFLILFFFFANLVIASALVSTYTVIIIAKHQSIVRRIEQTVGTRIIEMNV
jgi:hypothetical protein